MPRLYRHGVLGALAALATGVAASPVVAGGATLHVGFVERQYEVRPTRAEHRHDAVVTLTPHEGDLFTEGTVSGRGAWARAGAGDFVLPPGGTATMRRKHGTVAWTRVGDTGFTRVLTTESHTQTIDIVRDGETCAARVRFELLPGRRDFVLWRLRNDERMAVRRIDVGEVVCWIGDDLAS